MAKRTKTKTATKARPKTRPKAKPKAKAKSTPQTDTVLDAPGPTGQHRDLDDGTVPTGQGPPAGSSEPTQ